MSFDISKRAFNTYPLQDLYDKYDCFDQYPYSFSFIPYIRDTGLKEASKSFKSVGLKDQSSPIALRLGDLDISIRFVNNWLFNNTVHYGSFLSDAQRHIKSANKELSNSKICFSANPWDIATMSMRGIRSCMNWNSPQSSTIAGSVLDPYCAIIYLEDKNCNHTTNFPPMIARSLVRLVLNKREGIQLLLERVYSSVSTNISANTTTKVFKDYLINHSGLKVITSKNVRDDVVIPYHIESLEKIRDNQLSYRDSVIKYSNGI